MQALASGLSDTSANAKNGLNQSPAKIHGQKLTPRWLATTASADKNRYKTKK